MNFRSSTWKNSLFIGVILLGLVYALPNLFPEQPVLQIAASTPADVSDISANRQLLGSVQAALGKAQLEFTGSQQDDRRLTLRFQTVDTQLKARDVLSEMLGERYT